VVATTHADLFEAFFFRQVLPFLWSLERLDGTNELPLIVEIAVMMTSVVLSFCNPNKLLLYFHDATFWNQNTTPEFLRMSTLDFSVIQL